MGQDLRAGVVSIQSVVPRFLVAYRSGFLPNGSNLKDFFFFKHFGFKKKEWPLPFVFSAGCGRKIFRYPFSKKLLLGLFLRMASLSRGGLPFGFHPG